MVGICSPETNGFLPTPVVVSYSSLVQNCCKVPIWLPCLLLLLFPFSKLMLNALLAINSYSKMMQNTHLAALAPPVVVSYSILIQNWWKMPIWLPCLLLWLFPYSKLMQNALLAALPTPVVVSYSILI